MTKIIQLCPANRHEEGDVLMYALDSEGNVFRIIDGEDTAIVMSAVTFSHAVELHRKDGDV